MGSGGSIYDPVGNSLDCGDRREIMGGNGMQRGVLTAPTRQENSQDKSMLVIFSLFVIAPLPHHTHPQSFTHSIIKPFPRILNKTAEPHKFYVKLTGAKCFYLNSLM